MIRRAATGPRKLGRLILAAKMERDVQPLALNVLAGRQAEWLALRQKTISGNLANSDTPGYRAMDVTPFESTLKQASMPLATTASNHLGAELQVSAGRIVSAKETWDVVHSGNSVSIDQQLLDANDVRSAFSLNAAIVKTFNRMLLSSVKG